MAQVRRFVALASDLNENYSFYAPLTAAMWHRHGFTPLVILIGSADYWFARRRPRLVIEHLHQAGAQVHFTGEPYEAERSATLAQLSRLYACMLPGLRADDYILTSDVDMWPVGSWVGHAESLKLHLYNGNAYRGQKEPQYPMCYVGARAIVWRDIVRWSRSAPSWEIVEDPHPMRASLFDGMCGFRLAADGWLEKGEQEFRERAWDFDERYLGQLITRWAREGQRGDLEIIDRDMSTSGQRRLDRSSWRVPASLDGYADVHLPRPGFGDHWPSVRSVLALDSLGNVSWADEYWNAWMEGQL